MAAVPRASGHPGLWLREEGSGVSTQIRAQGLKLQGSAGAGVAAGGGGGTLRPVDLGVGDGPRAAGDLKWAAVSPGWKVGLRGAKGESGPSLMPGWITSSPQEVKRGHSLRPSFLLWPAQPRPV